MLRELKSSNTYPSDADWYIGFGDDTNTANEEKDVRRDDGKGLASLVMQQITPLK